MYCPQCNSEYREGFVNCAECNVPLIEGVPPEVERAEEEPLLRILLETTHPTPLDAIVVRLEEKNIPYIVQSGTALSLLEGVIHEILPADWKAIVLVPSEHLETAQRIAADASATTSDEEP